MEQRGRRTAARSSHHKLVGGRGSAGKPLPAWKDNFRQTQQRQEDNKGSFQKMHPEIGSRIFIQGLPLDVENANLEELLTRTIGPVHSCYMLYDEEGVASGHAIAHFQRAKDAMRSWQEYNGKVIDNRNPLRLQIVVDVENIANIIPRSSVQALLDPEPAVIPPSSAPIPRPKAFHPPPPPVKSLLERISGPSIKQQNRKPTAVVNNSNSFSFPPPRAPTPPHNAPRHPKFSNTRKSIMPTAGRIRKGARRLQKLQEMRALEVQAQARVPRGYQAANNGVQSTGGGHDDLDRELERYRRGGMMGLVS